MSAFPPSGFSGSDDALGAAWQASAPRGVDPREENGGRGGQFAAGPYRAGAADPTGRYQAPNAQVPYGGGAGQYQAPNAQVPYGGGAGQYQAAHGAQVPYGGGAGGYPASNWSGTRPTNALAVVSLVTGLLCFTFIPVIFGHIALGQIKRTGEGGATMAIIGLVLGYAQIVAGILLFLIFGMGMFWVVNS